jgi:hypothetical protein
MQVFHRQTFMFEVCIHENNNYPSLVFEIKRNKCALNLYCARAVTKGLKQGRQGYVGRRLRKSPFRKL